MLEEILVEKQREQYAKGYTRDKTENSTLAGII